MLDCKVGGANVNLKMTEGFVGNLSCTLKNGVSLYDFVLVAISV